MEDYDKYMILQEQLSRNEPILRRIAGGPGNLSRVYEVCLQPWPGPAVFRGENQRIGGTPKVALHAIYVWNGRRDFALSRLADYAASSG